MKNAVPNPIGITIEQDSSGQLTMKVDLTLDAVGLRARFRGLMLHMHNVSEPVFWDLSGKNPDFIKTFPCVSAPPRICITAYGITPDNALHLVFRNWGTPADGLKLFPEN